MERFKDVKLITCFIVLLLFTLGYFFMVNKLSYAFDNTVDLSKNHDNKIKVIEECAKKYGEINKNLFSEDDTIYIKVTDLVNAGLLATNQDENVVDIVNNKILNDSVIKIKKEKDNYSVEVNV